ncbi:MAG: TldD/PmbA family protein [Patescibacteria group bacterium]
MRPTRDTLLKAVTSAQADYCDIRVEERTATSLRFQGPILESITQNTNSGGIIRALRNGGWGTVSFNRLDGLPRLVDLAVRQAILVSKAAEARSVLATVDPVEDVVPLDVRKDPRSVPLEVKKSVCEEYNRQILSRGSPIASSSVSYADAYVRKFFANSEGTYIEQERIDVAGTCMALASRGRDTQMQHFGFGSTLDWDTVLGHEDRVREICDNAIALLDAPVIQGGEYTVILDPILAGVFIHEAFGHLSEGDNVYENEDLQALMQLGRRVGAGILSVYDTGLEPGARGYLRYDDEGVPTQKTYLIKNGVLTGRLHSRETAGKMGEAPTGNARAVNYGHVPIPRMRTTCIESGSASFCRMLEGISLGVYAQEAYGGQTDGEQFTFTAGRARLIRDGSLAEMVRDVTLTGNVFTTLKNIDLVGDDQTRFESPGGCGKAGQFPLPVSMWSPHIRVQNVVIGGKR